MDTKTRGKKLLYWASGLSMFAVLTHSIAAPDHLNEWWGYGTIFVIGAVFQFFFGIALLIQPWKYDEKGGLRNNADRYGRSYYILGLVLTAILVLVYIISRTTGMPFLGNEAVAEPVTILGLIPLIVNVILLGLLAMLIRRSRHISQENVESSRNSSL